MHSSDADKHACNLRATVACAAALGPSPRASTARPVTSKFPLAVPAPARQRQCHGLTSNSAPRSRPDSLLAMEAGGWVPLPRRSTSDGCSRGDSRCGGVEDEAEGGLLAPPLWPRRGGLARGASLFLLPVCFSFAGGLQSGSRLPSTTPESMAAGREKIDVNHGIYRRSLPRMLWIWQLADACLDDFEAGRLHAGFVPHGQSPRRGCAVA